jgi:hypothetical protein
MQVVAYKIIPDSTKNSISFSKNYRIFSTGEPVEQANRIVGFSEDLTLGTAVENNIYRKLRYSTDRANWSLWYSFTPGDLGSLTSLAFDEMPVFFEIKYEYDDTTFGAIATPLQINEVKVRVESTKSQAALSTPSVYCSDERCPVLVTERESSFKPYEVGTAIGIAKELSLQTNKIFGHEVIYFKTEPDRDSADFIFKEWTLFKTTERKCVKIMVPNNTFPDNKPSFTEFGVDFEVPFEIHIDHTYFQMMFGKGSSPRKRDYLFFPLLNRMYEIQGSYLFRGFMMEPIYWKVQLTKFHPNIDMLMKAQDRTFLDNLIVTTDQLFGEEAEVQKKDALNKQQYTTISAKFDEVRQSLHPDIKSKIQDFTFNYSPLIEYYYDMSGITPVIKTYALSETGNKTDQVLLTASQPYEIRAYETSEIFQDWKTDQLNTGDVNISGGQERARLKINGPNQSNTSRGFYLQIQGFRTIAYNSNERRNILETTAGSGQVQIKQADLAVVYKIPASTEALPNMTFSSLINFNKGETDVIFFKGYDDYQQLGLIIRGHIQEISGVPNLTVYIKINSTQYAFPIGALEYSKWYSLIIPMSSQFGQLEVNLYDLTQDPASAKNFNGIALLYSQTANPGNFQFVTNSYWCLPSANYSVANVRLFNTMVKSEDHEFIISQLFIRDESMLAIIDNARPRLNVPFIAINR